jgi:hypothetical protein
MSRSFQSLGPFARYSEQQQPFGSYAALAAIFNTGMVTAFVAAKRRGRIPERFGFADIVTMGFATHKIARLITSDSVTSFIRAPFVHLDEKRGTNTVKESPRGHGLQRSIGELVSCPECTGQWVAGALMAGMLHAPRVTRSITSMYTALALGDLLQFVYSGLKRRA